MAPQILPIQPYPTSFKWHLFFFDLNNDGIITLPESIRASLSLGLNLPASLVMSIGLQLLYGNTRPSYYGPFNSIDIAKIPNAKERYMLEDVESLTMRQWDDERGLDRREMLGATKVPGRGMLDYAHVWGIWAIAAGNDGRVTLGDIRLAKQGTLLREVAKRRRDRSDVLPFTRGGPLGVVAHSWVCERVFGVRVYRDYQSYQERGGKGER